MFKRYKEKNQNTTFLAPRMSSEQFRVIRTNLELMFDHGPALLMVTAPEENERKSAVTANLAIAFAEQGKKVLLIDANIDNPTLHELFHVSNKTGFSNVILNEESLMLNIIMTDIPWLSVLPVGSLVFNPSEFWITSKIKKFAEECRTEYDIVLFEVPALLEAPDPLVLANQCDGIILVIEENKTKKSSAFKIMENLRRSNIEILGVIYQAG